MAFWGNIAKFFIDIGTSFGVKGKLGNIIAGITGFVNAATIVVGVRGFVQARNMLAKGQDILANKTSAGGKIPVIYGTRRVGAQIIYMDVNANDSRDLYVVYALAVGEVDEIIGKSIELDGNRLTDSARFRDGGYIGTDKISSGNYSLNTVSQNGTGIDVGAGQFGSSPTSKYRYVMNLHHGAATQTADPMLVASMPNWTSAHKLNGIAYIAAHYGYDKEGIWSGVPQLTVQVRGKKVYDPRLDDTAGGSGSQRFNDVSTYAYSDNPALCFLNYITDNEVGKGLTESQINMSTFSSAADVCDTEVDNPFFGGVSKSLTWSGAAGDSFITIGGTDPNNDWWQNKIGELIDIYDNNGDDVITGKEITDIQRDEFFDQNPLYRVYFNDTLGTNYSTQSTGSSLAKIKRFHCNGYLDTNKNVMENAKELLSNMRGIFLYIDGKYELQIEDTGTSTFTITDDHIIADAGISVDYGNKDKKANKVIVEFFNANKRYELDTATAFHNATPEYYSDDNDEILEIKAEFPYVTDPYIAYNMAKAILVRSRKQMTIQFLGTPEMYKLNVGDIVTLNYVGTFDTSQTCRVEALELQPNGLVAVSLIEYFDVYTWETPPEEPLEELANLPSAYAVKAPTGLSFTDTDSSSTGRPFLSWDQPTDFPDYQYRVNVVDSSSNQVLNRIVDVENCDLNFIPVNANYVASVTSLNTLGTESDPTTLPFTVGDAPTGTPDIKNDAITTPKILDGNVTDAKIQSLTANKITAGTIDASVITVTNLDADNITSGSIDASQITVTNLDADNITSGTLDADTVTVSGGDVTINSSGITINGSSSSINLGSGAFTVSSAGVISATSGEVGGFTLGATSLTNTAADSKIQIGSGSEIFTVDGDGIYLGNATFANAPFKVLSSGEVQTTKSFTAGVAGSSEIAKMSGTGDYRFWSGNETPSNASFSVDKDGKAIAKNLVLKLTDGTVYFDSETGFSDSALSQISTSTGTRVSTVSSTFDSDLEYEEITVTANTTVNVSVSIDANFGGFASNSSDTTAETESKNDVPSDFTLTIEHSSDGGSNYATVVTDTFSRVETTPASDEYKINTTTQELFIGSQGGVIYLSTTTTSLNLGCVDSDGRTTLSYTGLSLSGTTSGTTHRIRASVSTSDASYDTLNNNVGNTAPRVLSVTDPSGDGFYVDNGGGSTVPPEGDITAVQITTASSSGLTGGANFTSGDASFTLALASSIDGAKTFTNNVVIQGDLDVQGTTTTIDTTNLDVKDKNITLNYGTGDTSANANGAGITIQDAVNSTTDATLTWSTSNDSFNFSHDLIIGATDAGNKTLTISGGAAGNAEGGEIRLATAADYDTTYDFYRIDVNQDSFRIGRAGQTDLTINSSGNATFAGNISVTGTVDGRDIATDGTKLDGIEAGATTDQTASEILAAIKTVDGSGSGLDADLLDGLDSTSFRKRIFSTSMTETPETRWIAFTVPFISGSGTSSYFYLDLVGYSDIGSTQSTLHYSAYIHVRSNGTSTNIFEVIIEEKHKAGSEQFTFGKKQITSTSNIVYFILPEDYSGVEIYNLADDAGFISTATASMFSTTDTDPTGITSITPREPLHTNDNISVGTISSGEHTIANGNQLKVYRSGDSAYVGLYMDTGENAILFNSWGSKYLTLTRDGDLKLTNTTFLDASRNLTNIGTISSGAINASTNTTLGGIKLTGNNAPVVQVTNGQTTSIARMMAQTTYSSVGTASNHPLQLRTNDTLALTIDTSQNATFSGTISSGAINATGDITITSTYPKLSFVDTDNNPDISIIGGSGQIAFYDETNSGYVYQYISNQHNFAAKNLTNIGTISSGAINSIGSSNFGETGSGAFKVNIHTTGNSDAIAIYATSTTGTTDQSAIRWLADNSIKAQVGLAVDSGRILSSTSADDFAIKSWGNIRFGNSSGTNTFTITSTGNLQVNGQTAIDSSRNLTNIGTISSGAINTTEKLTITNANFNNHIEFVRGSSTMGLSPSGNELLLVGGGLAPSDSASRSLGRGDKIWANVYANTYKIGTTDVIDINRNLTNIGTISSGAITANANTTINQFHCTQGSADDWQRSPISIRERSLNSSNSTSSTYAPNLNFHWAGVVSRSLTMLSDGSFVLGEWTASGEPATTGSLSTLNTGAYQINATTVIDSSRNLTNIGTISSGAITSTGAIVSTSPNNRFDALSIGDDSDIYLYEGSTNVLNIRTGASGSYKYFTFQDDGYFNTNSGGISTGGTARITNTGNLTNIGTISSGAITSTGINNASSELIDLDDSTYLILKDPQGSVGIYIGGTGDTNNYYDSNSHIFRAKTGGTSRAVINSSGVDAKSGGFLINGQTVIDSSRNLTNIASLNLNGKGSATSIPKTFAIANTGSGSNRYIKFGTISSIAQNGRTVKITVSANSGYNASNAQNAETIIRFKTSNNSSNQSGFYGDCQQYRYGDNGGAPSEVFVKQVSSTEFEFYGKFGSFTGEGSIYTVEHDGGVWTHSGSNTGTTAPSGTVLTATRRSIFVSGTNNFNANLDIGTGTMSAGTIIKSGGTDAQFLKADGSVQSTSASSPQGTTSPFNASANTLTFLINVAHLDGLVTGSQTGVLDLSTGELEINSQGEINIKANSIEASKIAANTITASEIASNTITGTQINADLLNVQHFDNVSADIKSHLTTETFVPLSREGQVYVQRTSPYTGSNASFFNLAITQVRNSATYVAIFSGVLGDVSGGRVQYSINGTTWVNASGNTNISWSAGTYRGYTYVYTGQITTLSGTQSTVYWRVYFSGSYNHTQLSLNVMMDNTQ